MANCHPTRGAFRKKPKLEEPEEGGKADADCPSSLPLTCWSFRREHQGHHRYLLSHLIAGSTFGNQPIAVKVSAVGVSGLAYSRRPWRSELPFAGGARYCVGPMSGDTPAWPSYPIGLRDAVFAIGVASVMRG